MKAISIEKLKEMITNEFIAMSEEFQSQTDTYKNIIKYLEDDI